MCDHDPLGFDDELNHLHDQVERLDQITSSLFGGFIGEGSVFDDSDFMAQLMEDGVVMATQCFDIIEALDNVADLMYWYAFKALSDFVTAQLVTRVDGYQQTYEGVKDALGKAHLAVQPGQPYRLPESFKTWVEMAIRPIHKDVQATITPEQREITSGALMDLQILINEDL